MWNVYLIAMQFPDDFFHFTATCACKYEKRHSWREVVPSHAGPLGVWARWCHACFDLSYSKAKTQKPGVNSEQHLHLQRAAGTLFQDGGIHFETASRAVSAGQTVAAEALLAYANSELTGVLVRSDTSLGHLSTENKIYLIHDSIFLFAS